MNFVSPDDYVPSELRIAKALERIADAIEAAVALEYGDGTALLEQAEDEPTRES